MHRNAECPAYLAQCVEDSVEVHQYLSFAHLGDIVQAFACIISGDSKADVVRFPPSPAFSCD